MGLQSTLPHKSTHAAGGSDPLTPAQIGAATAAQGEKADSASQPGHAHVIDDVSGLQAALDDFQTALGDKQVAGSYATLVGGLVPSVQLPSYVDDVLEYANVASLPATGEAGKIYVTLEAPSKCFRWSGSAFIEISPSPGSTDSVAEGVSNLYFTAARAQAANQAALDGKAAAGHTHDDRYYTEAEAETLFAGNSTKQLSGQQYFDPQGGWVQVAAFPTSGMRHMVEFGAFIADDSRGHHSTIKLLFVLDGYDNSGYSESYFPVSQISKHYGDMFVAARLRLNANNFPGAVYFDVKLSSSGVSAQFPTGNVRIVSWTKLYHRDVVYGQVIPNLTVVPAPDTTGHVMGPEFYPRNGILEKLTTGDYAGGREGATVANRVDNTIKTFHKGVWNQISPHVTSYNDLTDKPALGTAAATDATAYATAAQGEKADSASQPGHAHVIDDVSGLQGALDDFQTALGDKQVAGSYATAAQGAKADTALQPGTAIAVASLEVGNIAGTADLYVSEAGDVGIGTETPDARLSVVGNISATGKIMGAVEVSSIDGAYTLQLADASNILSVDQAAAITIPLDSAVAFPIGAQILLTKTTAGAVSIVAEAGVTLNAPGGASEIASQYGMAALLKVGADSWILGGDII